MGDGWTAFVSLAGRRLLARDPLRLPAAQRGPGVVLFADLAGFTPLSEVLASQGAAGRDAMRGLLHRCFGVLIREVLAAGGDVTTFAGDALTAVFGALSREDRHDTALRALACALRLQRDLPDVAMVDTPAGSRAVSMRVGVADGMVVHALVGDPKVRLLYVLAGSALARAVGAEQQAQGGEVVADHRLLAALPEVAVAETRGGGQVVTAAPDAPAPRPHPSVPAWRTSARFVHPVLAARLDTAQRVLLGEHRGVTSAFVALPDDPSDLQGLQDLQDHVAAALHILTRYDGELRQVDASDKGCQLVLTFGAPRGHADDAERAVACCLDLLAVIRPSRAGVATGLAFCGEVGGAGRRDYAVLGDAVNVAARLVAAAAPGELLVDEATARRVARTAEMTPRLELPVKGRVAPVATWSVQGLREPPPEEADVPVALVGREVELARLGALLDEASRGAGRVVALTGEPGIGKSCLASQLAATARERGWRVVQGACGSPADQRPYLLWRPVARALLGADADADGASVHSPGRPVGRPDSVRDPRLALLARALGERLVPDEPRWVRALDPRTRSELTRGLLLDLVVRGAAARPLLLVLEDCHWIDDASAHVLEGVAAGLAAARVVLLAVARSDDRAADLVERLAALPGATRLALDELTDHAAHTLVRQRLDQLYGRGTVPVEAVDRLVRRGGGSPLFLRELAGFVHASTADARGAEDVALPPDVQRLVVARVDGLDPDAQDVLKAASVVGPEFRADWVQGCLEQLGGGAGDVAARLARCASAGLVREAAAPRWEFTHALVQEATYATLGGEARSALHEAVGSHLELLPERSRADHVEALAHHFWCSGNRGKQRVWLRAAGDAAWTAYATEAAQRHYGRLLPLLDGAQRADVLVRLGSVWQLAGRWDDAERVLREAVAAADDDPAVLAAAHRELGVLLSATPAYDEGCRWLATAAEEFAAVGDNDGLLRTLDRLAFALFGRGDYDAALAAAQRQMAGQAARGDLAGTAAAADNLGCVHWMRGDYARARELLERAQQLAERSGDLRVVAHAANDLAGLCAERGDDATALQHLQEALSAARRIGYRELVVLLTSNAGELYRQRGQVEAARRCYTVALERALALGSWTTVAHCLTNLATAAVDVGAPDAAPLLELAAAVAARQDRPALLAEALHGAAVIAHRAGGLEEAARRCAEAERAAQRMDAHELHRANQVLRHRLDVALGARAREDAVRELEALLAGCGEQRDQVVVLEALAELCADDEECRRRAADLYRRLYDEAPRARYAEGYRRLTGLPLPAPPPLPDLDLELAGPAPELPALLARVADAVGRMPPEV